MAKISEATIQEIMDRTNFLAVYQEKIRLTKKGNKWWGLCPFHTERTPSFSIDAERGLFYCFGCHKGGSLIDFLMETEKLSFFEAVSELAEKANVPLKLEQNIDSREESERFQLYEMYEKLARAFHWLLVKHESGREALQILEKRGLSDKEIQEFLLGYAPADKNWLYGFLKSKGYSEEFLGRTGLFSQKNRSFPLFADRIIFPISDPKGRIIAFGGRLIHGEGPKYINSPDTAIFKKQENLFAFDKALEAIKATGTAVICEGYMDAISFHAAGVQNAVAPLGTAFTSRQAQLVRRRAEKVILTFDADSAGKKATERAISIAAAAGLEVMVASFKDFKDASEILEKQGPDALKKSLEYCINAGVFLIQQAREMFDLTSMEGKARAVAFFYPYLDALDSEVKQNAFIEEVSRSFGINSSAIQTDYLRAKSKIPSARNLQKLYGRPILANTASGARTADLVFMAAVALKPESFKKLSALVQVEDLDDSRAHAIFAALEQIYRETPDSLSTARIVELIEDESARRFILEVAASGELDENIQKLIKDGVLGVRKRSLEKKRYRLTVEIERALADPGGAHEKERIITEFLKEKMRLDAELSKLKGEMNE